MRLSSLLGWRTGLLNLVLAACFASCPARILRLFDMDVDKTITDIELLEQLIALRDPRPLRESDVCAANQRHDTLNAQNPWFRLWQRYGIPA